MQDEVLHPHAAVIDGLGGTKDVQAYLEEQGRHYTLAGVRRWRYDGIAHNARGLIVAMADQLGRRDQIPADFIEGVPTDAIGPLAA